MNTKISIPNPIDGKIRVLRIINRFNIGGPTYNATFLTKFIGDEYQTLLVGGMPEENEADSLFILEKYGVEAVLLNELKREPGIKSDQKAYTQLKNIIKEFRPHIVHTHASKAGALGRRAAKKCKVPVIIHTFHGHVFHSYFGKIKTELFRQIEKKLAKITDKIIAISELQKVELTEVFKIANESKFAVVNLGFDLQSFRDKRLEYRDEVRRDLGVSKNELAIGIVGRLAPIKDHKLFLDAIELVLEKSTIPVKVFVVGDGPSRESVLKQIDKINQKMGKEVIIFKSWERDIAKFNAGMDMICLSSKNEGTPVSLIEAQAAGIPVVSTDVGGVRDVVLDQKTGLIVLNRSTQNYAEAVFELIKNEKKLDFMSQNGWSYVEQKFSYQTLVKNTSELYKQILKEKKVKWQK